jgi:hypothetical protein
MELAHGTRWREQKTSTHILFGTTKGQKKKGWIIIKWTLKKLDVGGSVAWIHLAQGRGKWRFPVYTVVKIRVPYSAGNVLTR